MPSQVDLKDFIAGFLAEADEHLHAVNRNLVAAADALGQGRPEPRAVRELFRSLHTIKGLASMVGAEPIVDIAHEMEGVLRAADRARGELSERTLDLLLQGTRAVEERIRALAKQGIEHIPPAPVPLLEALAVAHSKEARPEGGAELELPLPDDVRRSLSPADREQLAQAALAGQRVAVIEFQPAPEKAAQGLNITEVRSRLARLGELVKVVPRAVPGAPAGIGFALLLVTNAPDDALAEAAGGPREAVQPIAVPRPSAPPREASSLEPEPAEWTPSGRGSIRVDVRKLDEALERLSELVVTRFALVRVAESLAARGADTAELDAVLAENTRQLRRLRAAITQARMVPLAELLQRLPLVARGLTRNSDKSLNVELRVGAAEVDKAVADRLFPAIVHLVRNAVDHAIEPRPERRRANKPEAGTLSIVCDDSSGTNLVLTVRDDGHGIDPRAVAAKLGRPVAHDDEELLEQIATPGLSTREDATHASGRGMGMDIVKRTVELLGGTLTLQSRVGHGTTFTLRVPVSITIVDAFSFEAGGQVFVAPVATVEEILAVDPAQVVPSPAIARDGPAAHLMRRRGEAVPLVALDAVLLRRPAGELPRKALVVNRGPGAVAFGIDRMLGQQEVVVRPLEDALVRTTGVSGATDLGDGRPTLVLDLGSLGAAIAREAA